MQILTLRPGLILHKTALDRAAQEALRDDIREILRVVPLFRPVMPARLFPCG